MAVLALIKIFKLSTERNIMFFIRYVIVCVSLFLGNNFLYAADQEHVDFKINPCFVFTGEEHQYSEGILDNVQGDSMHCESDNGRVTLKNVVVNLTDDLIFSKGHLDIKGDVYIRGNAKFVYASNQELTIYQNSRLIIDTGVSFCYVPKNKNPNLLICKDKTSIFLFKNATLVASFSGLRLTNGKIIFSGYSSICGHWILPNSSVVCGDGIFEHNMDIILTPHSKLRVCYGGVTFNNVENNDDYEIIYMLTPAA